MRNVQSNFFIQSIFLSLNFLEKKRTPNLSLAQTLKTKLMSKNKIKYFNTLSIYVSSMIIHYNLQ